MAAVREANACTSNSNGRDYKEKKCSSVSDCFKTVLDIVDQIFHILQPDGQSKQIMTDTQLLPGGRGQFLSGQPDLRRPVLVDLPDVSCRLEPRSDFPPLPSSRQE